jgi:hypothetical protein
MLFGIAPHRGLTPHASVGSPAVAKLSNNFGDKGAMPKRIAPYACSFSG